MIRFAYAGFLFWHPGFSEHTAYTILLIGITIDVAFEVFKLTAETGILGLLFGVFVTGPCVYLMWHQTWFAEHTVLSFYFYLACIVLAFLAFLHVVVAHDNSPRVRAGSRY